jgi:hypothetical protein
MELQQEYAMLQPKLHILESKQACEEGGRLKQNIEKIGGLNAGEIPIR